MTESAACLAPSSSRSAERPVLASSPNTPQEHYSHRWLRLLQILMFGAPVLFLIGRANRAGFYEGLGALPADFSIGPTETIYEGFRTVIMSVSMALDLSPRDAMAAWLGFCAFLTLSSVIAVVLGHRAGPRSPSPKSSGTHAATDGSPAPKRQTMFQSLLLVLAGSVTTAMFPYLCVALAFLFAMPGTIAERVGQWEARALRAEVGASTTARRFPMIEVVDNGVTRHYPVVDAGSGGYLAYDQGSFVTVKKERAVTIRGPSVP